MWSTTGLYIMFSIVFLIHNDIMQVSDILFARLYADDTNKP